VGVTIIEAQAEAWRLGFTTVLVQFAPRPGLHDVGEVRIMWRAKRDKGASEQEWAGAIDVPLKDVKKYLPMLLDQMVTSMRKWVAENVPEPEVLS
jgi:hypothetical protein